MARRVLPELDISDYSYDTDDVSETSTDCGGDKEYFVDAILAEATAGEDDEVYYLVKWQNWHFCS
jgi:hypothetical protein